MDRKEKEQVISEAIRLLAKNKGIYLRINKIRAESLYLFVDLGYNVDGKETHQGFYFGHDWCDPDYFGFSEVKNLRLPKNANDYQKVLLKMAYYFYKWYKEARQ